MRDGARRLTRAFLLSAAGCGLIAATPHDAAATGDTSAPPPVVVSIVAPGAPLSTVTIRPRLLLQSDAVILRHGPGAPALEDPETRPGVYLRRARVGADASAGIWRARILVEAAAQPETADQIVAGGPIVVGRTSGGTLDAVAGELAGGSPRTTEAFVAAAPHKAFVLAAGLLRVPLGLSRQIDEGDLRLPERARIITRATPDYRAGVAANGDLGLLQYALGAYAVSTRTGAAESSFADGGALYLLRLSGEPLGPMGVAPQLRRADDPWYDWWRFSAGVSAFYARHPAALAISSARPDEWGMGGDTQWQWRGVCITGEILWTRRADADRLGFTVEPGLFVWTDRLELVTRLEWFNDQVGPPGPADAWGATVGATFFSPLRTAHLQLAYTWRRPLDETTGGGAAAGWALLRATFTL